MLAVLEKCYAVLHGRRNSNAVSAQSAASTASTSTGNVLTKHMKKYIFDQVKTRLTRLDHSLYDIIWPSVKKLPQDYEFRSAMEKDLPAGIIAPDYYVYRVFDEFLEPIVKDMNGQKELGTQPDSTFLDGALQEDEVDIDLDLDPLGKNVCSGTLECTRNLEEFELPKYLNFGQLEAVERTVTSALLSEAVALALYPNATKEEIEEKGSGTYYTMNEVLEERSEVRVLLAANDLLVPLWNVPNSDRLHGKHWPYGRGVFVSNNANLAAWINVLDHLRIVTCTPSSKPGNIGLIYSRIYRLIRALNSSLRFKRDDKYGFLSARPSALGNTLKFNFTIRFPHLMKESEHLSQMCSVRGLSFTRESNPQDVAKIGNERTVGVTEMQTFEDYTTAVANVLQLEKDLAMTNSMHIAALFVNMFKRKKSHLINAN